MNIVELNDCGDFADLCQLRVTKRRPNYLENIALLGDADQGVLQGDTRQSGNDSYF
jgi:hypothetical protein